MIMAATMDPKPEKLQQNITLKFRNLKVGRKEQIIKRSKVPVKINHNYIVFQVADGKRHCVFWNDDSKGK